MLDDKTGYSSGSGEVTTFAIITPAGAVVKGPTLVDPRDIWDNMAAYSGGFAIRVHNLLYFFDNAGNPQYTNDINVSSGLSFGTGREDASRIGADIRSHYVYLAGASPEAPHAPVCLAVWDARTGQCVATNTVTNTDPTVATIDQVTVAADANDRVCVAYDMNPDPSVWANNQVVARIGKFDGANVLWLTPSFYPFVNSENDPNNVLGYLTSYPSVAMTTNCICIAASGTVNSLNNNTVAPDTYPQTTLYTVISVTAGTPAGEEYKADNSLPLNQAASWTNNAVPTGTEFGVWDATVAAENTTNSLGADLTWGGIRILNPGGPLFLTGSNMLTLNGVSGTGIDLSSAAQDLTVNCGVTVASNQTWTVAANRTLAVDSLVVAAPVQFGGSGELLIQSMSDPGVYPVDFNGASHTSVGTVSGGLSVALDGSGTVALTGNNTYSGGTIVSNGTLILAGDNSAASGMTYVGSGATLQLQATVNNTVGGACFALGTNTLWLASGSALELLADTNANFTGGAPPALEGNVSLYAASLTAGGSNQTVAFGLSGIDTTNATVTLSSANPITVQLGSMRLRNGPLVVVADPGVYVDLAGIRTNGIYPADFQGSSYGSPSEIEWNFGDGSANNTSRCGPIDGVSGLTKDGNAALILWATNSYPGPTVVSNGVLVVSGRIEGGGAVTVYSGVLGGGGSLDGPVTVQAGGMLSPGIGIGTMTVNNTLALTAGSTTMMQVNKSAATNDQVRGITTLTYGGTLVVTNLAGTLAAGDSFKLFDAASYSGSFASISPATPGNGIVWDMSRLPVSGTLSIIFSSASLSCTWTNKSGGSWLVPLNWSCLAIPHGVSATADFSTLSLNNDVMVTLDSDPLVGYLLFDDQNSTKHNWTINPGSPASSSLTLAVSNGSPVITVGSATTTISAVVAGTSGLAKSGPGTLLLSGNNTFSGTVNINQGPLWVKHSNALGNGPKTVTCNNGTLGHCTLHLDGTGGNLTLPPGIDFLTSNTADPGTVCNEGGDNVINGNFTLTMGGGSTIFLANAGSLTLNGTITPNTSGRGVVFAGPANSVANGVISDGTGGSMFLLMQGTGAATLNAANTYSGTTQVRSGTLLVNGSLAAASAVTVKTNATLGGIGLIHGPVSVQAGATLSPGIGIPWPPHTLTISNTLALAAGSTTVMQLNKTAGTNDQVRGVTTLTYGGTLVLTSLAGTLAAGDSFKLFDAANYTGSFAAISPASPGLGVEWDTRNLPVNGTVGVALSPPTVSQGGSGSPPGSITLSFQTQPGWTYEVEYKDSLNDPLWHVLFSVVAISTTTTLTDLFAPPDQRFYRLVCLGLIPAPTTPFETPAAPPASPGGSCGTAPDDSLLYLFSGEFHQTAKDLVIKSRGMDFVWSRTYRSKAGQDTTLGNGWSLSYDIRVVPNGSFLDVYDGTGRKDTYRLQTNGTYTVDQIFCEGTLSNGVFVVKFPDTGTWEFLPLDGSSAQGKISRIRDRNNNTFSLSYDPLGRLLLLVDTHGRTNSVSYNSDGFVSAVTDFTGRQVTYTYYQNGDAGGSFGDLKSVTSPPSPARPMAMITPPARPLPTPTREASLTSASTTSCSPSPMPKARPGSVTPTPPPPTRPITALTSS